MSKGINKKTIRQRAEELGAKIDQPCPPGKTCEDLIESALRDAMRCVHYKNRKLGSAVKIAMKAFQHVIKPVEKGTCCMKAWHKDELSNHHVDIICDAVDEITKELKVK
jgi:hypothetical protein